MCFFVVFPRRPRSLLWRFIFFLLFTLTSRALLVVSLFLSAGIDDPYEPPEAPELVLDTSKLSVLQSVQKIFSHLENEGYIAAYELCVCVCVWFEDKCCVIFYILLVLVLVCFFFQRKYPNFFLPSPSPHSASDIRK